jgi:hypothetical protein
MREKPSGRPRVSFQPGMAAICLTWCSGHRNTVDTIEKKMNNCYIEDASNQLIWDISIIIAFLIKKRSL